MKSVLIVGGYQGAYGRMFLDKGWMIVEHLDEADLVQFTGGEDVTPMMYNESPHPQTYYNPERDQIEGDLFYNALHLNKPMAGICRGGQFLNVMCGGRMFQHVTKHCQDHLITDVQTGDVILVTSTHHQMMRPGPTGEVVAYANQGSVKEHMENDKIVTVIENDEWQDVEVVKYSNERVLCFQPHPEFPGYPGMTHYYFKLLEELVNAES